MKIDKGLIGFIICIVLLAILIIVPIVYAPQPIPPETNNGDSIDVEFLHNDSIESNNP
jgi:hypothetical protein